MNQSAKHAMDRYLKDLKQALYAAPKATREDALRDATEFLSNEIASSDAEQLATSEQQVYDHFTESYGLPGQVAMEYLQAQSIRLQAERSSNLWKYLAVALTTVLVAAGAFFFETHRTPPKVSPFTQVDFQGDKVLVEFNGTTYEWLGIDDIPVSKVIASSKKQFRDLWRKRITEDLVEVLWGMGHYPGNTVKLQLQDIQDNAETTVAAAPMTRANRQSMYGQYPIYVASPQVKHE
jgi:hypothetical protein